LVLRGQWLDCAFRRFASLCLPGARLYCRKRVYFWSGVVVVGIARAPKGVARTIFRVVIAGLDPAIHGERRLAEIRRVV
jgi:hypothetical protein